jgi:hypothetical protein
MIEAARAMIMFFMAGNLTLLAVFYNDWIIRQVLRIKGGLR